MSMTVIEALVVTLGMDRKKYEEGAKATEKDQQHLRAEAEKTANEMQQRGEQGAEFFSRLKEAAVAFFAAVAGYELKEFAEHTIQANASALELSETLGVSVEQLEQYQAAAQLRGGTAEGFTASLKGLNENLVAIEKHLPRFKRSLVVFGAAGLHEADIKGKDLFEVLGLLADRFKGLSGAEALALGQRMGLDEGTIRLLREGKKGVEELAASTKGLVATQKEAEESLEAEHGFAKLRLEGQRLGQTLLTMAMPAIKAISKALEALAEFAREHPDGMKALFLGLAAGITAVGIAAGAAAIATFEISVPLLILGVVVGALAAAFYYLYQEYENWKAGASSDFAPLFQLFDQLKDAVMQFREVWDSELGGIWDLVKQYLGLIMDDFKIVMAIMSGDPEKIKDAFVKSFNDTNEFMEGILKVMVYTLFIAVRLMMRLWDNAWASMESFASDAIHRLIGQVSDFASIFGGIFSAGGSNVGANLAVAYAGQATPGTASGGGSSSSFDSRNQSRNVHIDTLQVQTAATDAHGIGNDIGRGAIHPGLIQMADGGM